MEKHNPGSKTDDRKAIIFYIPKIMYWSTLLSPKVGKINPHGFSKDDALLFFFFFVAGINLETVPSSTMTNVLGRNHLYIDPNKEYLF